MRVICVRSEGKKGEEGEEGVKGEEEEKGEKSEWVKYTPGRRAVESR